jgi:PAS domain S-box-containing protein
MNDVVGEQIDFAALVQVILTRWSLSTPRSTLCSSTAGVELLGWKAEDWQPSLLELVHPDDVAVMVSSATTVLGKSQGTPVEVRVRCADDSWRRVEIVGRDAFDHPGVRGLVIMVRDITQRRMWEVAAGDTAVFQQLVQHGSSITLLLDDAGRISSVNAAFTRLLGHDPSLTVDHCLVEFCAPGSAADLETAVELASSSGSVTSCEVAMRNSDPTVPPRPIRFEIVNLLDDPVIGGFVVTGHDVSDLHRARRSLEHLARHDALTGLANRSVLIEQLEQISRSTSTQPCSSTSTGSSRSTICRPRGRRRVALRGERAPSARRQAG